MNEVIIRFDQKPPFLLLSLYEKETILNPIHPYLHHDLY